MEEILEGLDKKKSSSESRTKAFGSLVRLLGAEWGAGGAELSDRLGEVLGAVRLALRGDRGEEKLAALVALRAVLLEEGGLAALEPLRSTLEHLAQEEGGAVGLLALEVLVTGLLLCRTQIEPSAIDKAMALCRSTRGSHAAFAALLTLKSNDDILDLVVPDAQWLLDRFIRAPAGPEQVDIGWAACSLFCALREKRGEDGYDPYELDGFVAVDSFSDALRSGAKALRPLEKIFDEGRMPAESLTFHDQKQLFEGFRKVMIVRFLRPSLQRDFAVQMAENPYLFDLLGYHVESKVAKVKLSGVEKRMMKSPNSVAARSASKDLKKNRERKTMMQSFGEDQ